MRLKTPLQRLRRGAIVLGSIFLIAVIGFHFLGEYDWVSAIWMVVITISTVGYGEQSAAPPSLKLFTVFVIVFGISAAAYTFGGMMQLILEGELERVIGNRRMTQEISRLKNHVIICGFGRMGQNLAHELKSQGHSIVILDHDSQVLQEAIDQNYMGIVGDATDDSVLETVGIGHAKTIVTALPSDANSVFITLTARNLNPSLQIIARAEQQNTEQKLRQAGANRVVMPAVVGARQMARMITRPTTADLIDLVSQQGFVDLELDEVNVPQGSCMVGMSVRETEAHRIHKLLVVAIKPVEGDLVFNPDADHIFQPDDTVILMGHSQDIQRFLKEHDLAL